MEKEYIVDRYWYDYNPSGTYLLLSVLIMIESTDEYSHKCLESIKYSLPKYFWQEIDDLKSRNSYHTLLIDKLSEKIDKDVILEIRNFNKSELLNIYKNSGNKKLIKAAHFDHIFSIFNEHFSEDESYVKKFKGMSREVWNIIIQDKVKYNYLNDDVNNYLNRHYSTRLVLTSPINFFIMKSIFKNWKTLSGKDLRFGYDGYYTTLFALILLLKQLFPKLISPFPVHN